MQVYDQPCMALLQDYYRIVEETKPENLSGLTTKQLQQYYSQFAYLRGNLTGRDLVDVCVHRMELIRGEIQTRRMEAHSERQHRELFGKARWTLFWAAVGGVTGIALVILAVWPLAHDTFFSKAQPASVPQSAPVMPLQSQSATNAGVEPEPSSSTSTASPQPTAEETPSSQ